jgi:hypothetical protein
LWAIELTTGDLDVDWGAELSGGAGQGAVAGNLIFWPTSQSILLVDRRTGRQVGDPIELPAGGGANLAVAADAESKGQYIVAAGPEHLAVFRQARAKPAAP